jgi:hypothetical protein
LLDHYSCTLRLVLNPSRGTGNSSQNLFPIRRLMARILRRIVEGEEAQTVEEKVFVTRPKIVEKESLNLRT